MIESTLGSLAAIMVTVWAATQLLKQWLPVPQNLLALIVGEVSAIVFWQAGWIEIPEAPRDSPWSWGVVALLALFAVATAAKSHDVGSDPSIMVRRVKGDA